MIVGVVARRAVLVAVLLSALAAPTGAAEPLRPRRVATPPVIDGRLDDEAWQQAPAVSEFKTWMPDYGADLSERTVAYYAYDAANLYFAFRAYDREPAKIKASMAARDTTRPDDWICINIDSFLDRQSIYSFYVNPLGIQSDSRFAANKEDFGFDTVWYSAGRIDSEGYTIEVRIPFKSLRYEAGSAVTMGVIFERMISRKSEDGTVPALDPKMGFNFVLQTAPMVFEDVAHYTLLELLPAVTYGHQQAQAGGRLGTVSSGPSFGLTGKYGITARLTADGTYNPDFSQVEADAGQIDINRRAPLFFAEKRPFFLEGQDVFNLGGPSQAGPLQAVVHTRTIVNPIGGVKISGKLTTTDTLSSIYAADELPDSASSTYAHVFIARYKHALAQDSYLGGFYTGREGAGSNKVAGTDGSLRIDKSSAVGFYALGSATRPDSGGGTATGRALGVEYSRDTREMTIVVGGNDLSRGFVTETGYVTRTGVTSVRATVAPKFYPAASTIQRIQLTASTEQTRDAFARMWETYDEAAVSVRFAGTTVTTAGCHYSTEIYAGEEFGTSGCYATASAQIVKQVRVTASYANKGAIYYAAAPFGGRTSQASASVVYQPFEQWSETLSLTYANFDRNGDRARLYDYGIVRSRTSFQVNRFLFVRAIVEYNSFRRQMVTDFLASFTYIPGTVLHAGYGSLYERTAWDGSQYGPARSFLETRRGLFFKASYLWRL